MHYAFRERMPQEFEVIPSRQIEQLYTLATDLYKREVNVSDIFKLVCEDEEEQRAFFCTFEVFQKIVVLEKRHLARSGEMSALVIVRLGEKATPALSDRAAAFLKKEINDAVL